MDHYIIEHNSECARAIFDNCITTDSREPENLLIDFSVFANETETHEMKLIAAVNQLDVDDKESVNKKDDDVTVSPKFKFKGPIIYFIEGRSPSRHKKRFCI